MREYMVFAMVPTEEVSVELNFNGDIFSGEIRLPYMRSIPLQGVKDRGPSLSEMLIEEVAPYRKTGVTERSDEEIRKAVDELLGHFRSTGEAGCGRSGWFDHGRF
ncbi:hypothetical protein [Paenibacillus whitsoniae]|uniref:Uncharacterized protein n=1 Tax=Paenibacillus whitsoniae TaxID=2496558 RepID=A0A3S0AE69_9BACL|nr:hypothetical protein [Paenibacillus whitsoniae]RTE10874.1 hypothetical protein EJQ19_06330 [Paenibacillus whitsoniae]